MPLGSSLRMAAGGWRKSRKRKNYCDFFKFIDFTSVVFLRFLHHLDKGGEAATWTAEKAGSWEASLASAKK